MSITDRERHHDDEGDEGEGKTPVVEPEVLAGDDEPEPLDAAEPARPAKAGARRGRGKAMVPARAPGPAYLDRLDPLRAYMEGVRRYRLLTPEEEHDLATRFRASEDPKLAHKLVTANLRLVVKIANEYRSHWTNLLDLIQEGNIGLMQAVKRFDPLRGVRLSSYAQYWIRAYIIYYLLANFRLVKVGTTQAQRKLFFRLQRAREQLLAMGITPTPKLLGEKLEVSEEDVRQMSVRLDSPEVSLDATPKDGEHSPLVDSLRSAGADPEAETGVEEIRDQLARALHKFGETITDEREKVLWHQRMLTDDPATLQDIGARFNISRERARQLEERLKKRCKEFLTKELGSDVKLAFLET